ncbi:MAG: glycosyltransferase family 4 protein, partial [Anaerolineaceae bacterium]
QRVPTHERISYHSTPSIRKFARPRRFFEPLSFRTRRLLQRRIIGDSRNKIWHSTYYTEQLDWEGPKVVTMVDAIHERFPELFTEPRHEQLRIRMRRCLSSADIVIAISETTKKDIVQIYELDAARIRVIPLACSDNLVSTESNRLTEERSGNPPFFLYVGRRGAYKDFETILTAMSLSSNVRNAQIVAVGPPATSRETERLKSLGLDDRVTMLNDVGDRQLESLYRNAMALLFPSLYEGFGIPLLEAMACGCPIIASRIPSTLEVARDCPIYFEAGNAEQLAGIFDDVGTSTRKWQRAECGDEVSRQFSWAKTANLTLNVYRELLKG